MFAFWFQLGRGGSPAAAKPTEKENFGIIVRSIFVDWFGSVFVEVSSALVCCFRVPVRRGRLARLVGVGKNRNFADLFPARCLLSFRLDFRRGWYGAIVLISGPARPGRLARLGVVGPELTQDLYDPFWPNSGSGNYLIN